MKTFLHLLAALGLFGAALTLSGCFEDKRTPGEKVSDAATDLKNGRGVGNAAEELTNKTPGERVGDAVEDAGQDIKKNAR